MCSQPIAGVFLAVACGTQVLFYLRCMLDIAMAVIAGDFIVRDMVLMHETEIVVFVNPFFNIMARIALTLRNNIICTSRYICMAIHALEPAAQVTCMIKVRVIAVHFFGRAMAGRASGNRGIAWNIPEMACETG